MRSSVTGRRACDPRHLVIVSITLREPGHEELVRKLRSADTLGIGAPSLTEAGMVLSARLGVEPQALLDRVSIPRQSRGL